MVATAHINLDNAVDEHETPQAGCSRFVIALAAFAAIGGFLFGYDTGVVSGAMLLLKDEYHLSNTEQELVVSVTVAGAIVGAVAGGKLTDARGRKPVILAAALIFMIGALELSLAQKYYQLIIGRAILGLAIGLSSMAIPMYLAETAPSSIRGRLLTINVAFITGGQFIAGLVDGAFSGVHEGWRYMLGLAAVPAFIQLLGFSAFPESPRWLVSKGRLDEAENNLRRIRGTYDVSTEMNAIQRSFSRVEEKRNIWHDLRTMPALRRALLIGGGLQAFQQLVGINTVMYYSATILKQAGVRSTSDAIWGAAGIAGANFVFTLVGMHFVEKSGRRGLLLASLTGVIGALVMLGISFHLNDTHSPATLPTDGCAHLTCSSCVSHSGCGYCAQPFSPNGTVLPGICHSGNDSDITPSFCADGWAYSYCPSPYSWLAVLSLCLYIAFFAPGMGPMPWTVNGEIYPPSHRAFGNSFATAINWLGNLLISMTFLDLIDLVTEAGAFWLYSGIAALAWLFVYTLLPETKGKTLEEIEKLLVSPPKGGYVALENDDSSSSS
eukprot:m.14535 g.14535  ORF g.14535 m.14535 type:complete len:552 (-) comp7155_c0_seq1:1758-3413(-)